MQLKEHHIMYKENIVINLTGRQHKAKKSFCGKKKQHASSAAI
jgi:hypothetical protein